MIADTNDVFACYGLYILFQGGIMLIRVYLEFVSVIKVAVIIKDDLDYYGYTDNSSYFCKSYYDMIFKKKIPKFGSANCMNISLYWKYSAVFNDLSFIKEIFIACAHPIMSIIKLRLSGSGIFVLYHRI